MSFIIQHKKYPVFVNVSYCFIIVFNPFLASMTVLQNKWLTAKNHYGIDSVIRSC